MTREKLLDLFTRAIALRMGYLHEGSQAQLNHNPGGLTWWCNLPAQGGMVVFESEAYGWEALRAQCANNIFRRGLNFEEFFAGRKAPRYRGFAPDWDERAAGDFVLRFLRQRDRIPEWVNTAVQIRRLVNG